MLSSISCIVSINIILMIDQTLNITIIFTFFKKNCKVQLFFILILRYDI